MLRDPLVRLVLIQQSQVRREPLGLLALLVQIPRFRVPLARRGLRVTQAPLVRQAQRDQPGLRVLQVTLVQREQPVPPERRDLLVPLWVYLTKAHHSLPQSSRWISLVLGLL